MGHPENISISGTIENKVDHQTSRSGHTYSIKIVSIDDTSYDIPVSQQLYDMYYISEGITVKAKKDSLGIVYDEEILNNKRLY